VFYFIAIILVIVLALVVLTRRKQSAVKSENKIHGHQQTEEEGDVLAQFALGMMYATGRGVDQDDVQAVKWLRLAAEQGHTEAQDRLGDMYAAGRGVDQDEAEAVKWYRLAAEQGDEFAQFSLGEMVAAGRGVEQDDAEALKWFKLAAEQGHAPAQDRFVEIAARQGVAQDAVEAAKPPGLLAEREDENTSISPAFDEEEPVPPPEADALFRHANWRYRKNPQESDGFRETERLLRIAAAWGHKEAASLLAKMSITEPAAPDDGTTADDSIETDDIAPLPGEERIGEMALVKSLHPETGLPVIVDLPNSLLLDPETGNPLKTNVQTFRLLNRMR